MASRLIQAIVAEVRRRKVFRAMIVYAVSAWLILQIGDLTLEPLGFPDWSMQALILFAVIGFPLVFVLTWCIQTGPDGFMFDLPLWHGLDPDQPRSEGTTDLVVLISLILLLGAGTFVGIRLFLAEIADFENSTPELIARAPPNSIAVLQFANFAGREEADHFANGLAEEILDMLASVNELSVAARTSSFQFRDEDVDIREIAQILSVQHLLEGSVRQDGQRIRGTIRLVDGESGDTDWVENYERELDDIFALQQEIASAVVEELRIVLSVKSEESLRKIPTKNIDAYVLYLKGKGRLRSSQDPDVIEAADELFDEAIALDSAFARAYAGVCEAQLKLYENRRNVEDFEAARFACNRARTLDPALDADILIALSNLYLDSGQDALAEEYARKVIADEPTSVDAHIALGEALMAQNRRPEAEATFKQAIIMQPGYWRAYDAIGNFYFLTDRYPESVHNYSVVVSLVPEGSVGYAGLGAAHWMMGNYDEAEKNYQRSFEIKPDRHGFTNMGLRYYYKGEFENAADMQRRALELAPNDHRIWGRLAESYRFIEGKQEEAFDAYQRAAGFAEQNLRIDDTDWRTMGLLGLYYAHTGRDDLAIETAARAVSLSRQNAEMYYYQGLALLRIGNTDAALDALENAVAADDDYRQFMQSDPDLKLLADTDRYAALLRED